MLRFALVTDGSSDDVLNFPIRWLLRDCGSVDGPWQWVDFRRYQRPPRSLRGRIQLAISEYPAEILFVHRDAEGSLPADRQAEITAAITTLTRSPQAPPPPCVCVIPVRMTEAWLLHDEAAIRRAAGNPNGQAEIRLPIVARLEATQNPKQLLDDSLLAATAAGGRRLQRVKRSLPAMRRRVGELIQDYSPLRHLTAFKRFEAQLASVLDRVEQRRDRSGY